MISEILNSKTKFSIPFQGLSEFDVVCVHRGKKFLSSTYV